MLCDKHIYILTSRYEGMPLTVFGSAIMWMSMFNNFTDKYGRLDSATSMWLDNAFVIVISIARKLNDHVQSTN